MPNDLTTRARVPGPDDAAHDDGLLMHDLTVVNTMIGRYVLRFLDADASPSPSRTSWRSPSGWPTPPRRSRPASLTVPRASGHD